MSSKKLLIYGIGETAEIAFEYFTYDSDYDVVAFVADQKYIKHKSLLNLPIVPFEDVEKQFSPDDYVMFAASTYNKLNRVRALMYKKAKAKNYEMANYISSKAFVWRNVVLGDNVMIFEGNVLQHHVNIGNNVVLWSGNHIGHRTIIEDNVYISSHCVISGFCKIGKNSFLGVNSTFNDNIYIAEDNIVGSGALVVKNSEKGNLLVGSPAKRVPKTAYDAFDVTDEWMNV